MGGVGSFGPGGDAQPGDVPSVRRDLRLDQRDLQAVGREVEGIIHWRRGTRWDSGAIRLAAPPTAPRYTGLQPVPGA